jgi:hypothetical protein
MYHSRGQTTRTTGYFQKDYKTMLNTWRLLCQLIDSPIGNNSGVRARAPLTSQQSNSIHFGSEQSNDPLIN